MQGKRVIHRVAGQHGACLTAFAFAVLGAASAHAQVNEPSPYSIGLRETLAHDSNVFRTNEAVSANSSITTLFGGFDQQISRQRVYANGNVSLSRYSGKTDSSGNDTSSLNNTSYGVSAGWNWETIEKLSGSLTANISRSLASLGDNSSNTQTIGNLVTTQQYGASARLGGQGIVSLESSLSYSKVSYSDQSSSDSSSSSGSIGGYYRLGPSLRLGTALRYSRSDTAETVAGPNRQTGRYVDFMTNWVPTSTTGVYTRLSWAHQTNSQAQSRDFNGLTGSVQATYTPTAKLSFNTTFSRDAGVNGSFFTLNPNVAPSPGTPTPTPVTGLSESSQVTNGFTFGANYAATSKVSVNAGVQLQYAKLADNLTAGTTTSTINRNDNSKQYSLGVSYAAARFLSVGCSISRATRELDASVIAPGLSYSANVTSCQAELSLR